MHTNNVGEAGLFQHSSTKKKKKRKKKKKKKKMMMMMMMMMMMIHGEDSNQKCCFAKHANEYLGTYTPIYAGSGAVGIRPA